MNHVLVDGGAAMNLVPESMLGKLRKISRDLVQTNVAMTGFNGKTSAIKGIVLLNIKVESIDKRTMFVVVPSKARYNLLLGKDWIHGVSAIPQTFTKGRFFGMKIMKLKSLGLMTVTAIMSSYMWTSKCTM